MELIYCYIILTGVLFGAYTVSLISYFKKFIPQRKYSSVAIGAAILINILFYMGTRYFLWKTWLIFIILVLIILAEFYLIFQTNVSSLMYAVSLFSFHIILFHSIVVAVISFIVNEDMYIVFTKNEYSILGTMISLLLSVIFIQFARKFILTDEEMGQFINNSKQLRFIAVCRISVMVIILLIHQQGHIYRVDVVWYSLLNLIISIVGYFTLIIILRNSVAVSRLVEYEIRSRLLKDQLERQMQHYKSYQKYTESFRAFKHDYKNILLGVRGLVEKHDCNRVIKMLESVHDTLQKTVDIHKQYSNNLIVDAILQDTKNACEENNIRFAALANIPDEIGLNELDICRVFSNVANNAVEACIKVTGHEERFIEITSGITGTWATVEFANSFNGQVEIKNGELITLNSDKEYHGFGLKIVKKIIEDTGGFIQIKTDLYKNIFKIRIHFPLS